MKSRIFMYLFVFAMLFVVFQYVNSKHILDTYEADINKSKENVQRYKDSIVVLNPEIRKLKALDSVSN